MKEQIDNLIEWVKQQDVKGCITGSCLLGYFEGQDVDVFLYTEKSFTKIMYAMYYNPMFTILDKKENFKLNKYMNTEDTSLKKNGIITIKFLYNTCVPINIVVKRDCTDIFKVLSSFDMDIICKGYDIQLKRVFDFTNGSTETRVVDWNRLNPKYNDPSLWSGADILRQSDRAIKYHMKYDCNTDKVVHKYISIIKSINNIENIFDSEVFDKILEDTKTKTEIIEKMLNVWLETHIISEEDLIEFKKLSKSI